MEKITIDDLKKVEMKVGKIISVETIEGSEKLLKLLVDLGESSNRQILSGIAKYFSPDVSVGTPTSEVGDRSVGVGISELVGLKCIFVTNLEPRMMMGLESQGMLLAVSGKKDDVEFFSPLKVSDDVAIGSIVK